MEHILLGHCWSSLAGLPPAREKKILRIIKYCELCSPLGWMGTRINELVLKIEEIVNVLFHRAETRAVRRLHHSAEAICSELPRQSSHQCPPQIVAKCENETSEIANTGLKGSTQVHAMGSQKNVLIT
ncbi:hypothetical protein H5410_009329 [Solanum commersonii]|uniref:Uncharacterized protein n=1 Tax=Solanum commersonii TaxID=4109 RepID=A0A9J6AJB3_SOLCO|nr:hypothetical protein H5410_009329 [Solanum commersonii]